MLKPREMRNWVATSDDAAARALRRTVRLAMRTAARLRSGSVTAEMDRIVAEANSATTGSALPAELLARSRRGHRRSPS